MRKTELLIPASNLEVLNASMIDNNICQCERLEKLNITARKELSILSNDNNILDIEKLDNDTKKDILIYAVVLDEKQINKYSNILEKINLENIETLNKNYNKYIKELSDNTSKEFTYIENGAKLTIDSEKEKFIVLTIPYDKGWTITNNKQKIAYENVDNGLIGITISEGKNNIEMTYKTPGLKLSLIISIISIISLSTYLLLIKTKRLVL